MHGLKLFVKQRYSTLQAISTGIHARPPQETRRGVVHVQARRQNGFEGHRLEDMILLQLAHEVPERLFRITVHLRAHACVERAVAERVVECPESVLE